MSYTTTPNLGLLKPSYLSDDGQWGNHLNANADTLDAVLKTGTGGTFLPLSGGTMLGPLNYTATSGTTSRAAQDRAADIANVLDFGADPTGAADSAPAFQAALATGRACYAPVGTYLIRKQLTVSCVNQSQTLYGDGVGATTLVVDGAFDPTVTTGVIVLTNTQNEHRPELADLAIRFVQPLDIVTTATAAVGTGPNPITVASAAGITVGMSVVNRTNPGSILAPVYQVSSSPTTVTGIAGNVVSLNRGIASPGVSAGDTIQFASVRSQFKTLAAGGTATQGGTGIMYPWAVYASPTGTALIERVMIVDAWDGVYVRGSSFQIEKLDVFAFDVGLDIDGCHNFASLIDYRFWPWGNRPDLGQRDALTNVYYDGATVSANIGATDGGSIVNFQAWRGNLNITSTFTWGTFSNLMLDGDNTNLNILANSGAWLQIDNFYSTQGPNSLGKALVLNAANPKFRVTITGCQVVSSAIDDAVLVASGILQITDGYFWDGLQSPGNTATMLQVSGGSLYLGDCLMDASGPRTDSYIGMSGTAALKMHDCTFIQAAGTGGIGLNAGSADSILIDNVVWNGWSVNLGGATPNNAYRGFTWLPASTSYANDAAAAAAGVAIGQLYRNGSVLQVRVT